ncbi:MAG: hypothetical protein ABR605_06805, partial [Desulfurivibrionaceae bacterium]
MTQSEKLKETMDIICPECGKIHKLVSDRLPARKFTANCKQCGARMIIEPVAPPAGTAETGENAEEILIHEKSQKTAAEEFDILLTDHHEEEPEPPAVSREDPAGAPPVPPAASEESGADAGLFTALPELRKLSPDKFAYREIFTGPGKHGFRTRQNRRILKTVTAVHDLLSGGLLAEGEKVLRIARGISYHPFEIPYANGLLTMPSNYFAIVCTDKRVLLINVNRRLDRPTRYIFQIPYDEIAGIGRGLFRSSLIIKHRSAGKWNFTTVNRTLAASVKDFIAARVEQTPAPPAGKVSLPQLCPSCHTPLPAGLASCPHCGAAFKNPREALVRSLILPGLGSIYLGYLPRGLMEITGYPVSWLLTVILLVFQAPGGIGVAIIPVAAYHLGAGLLAWKTAGKGY